MKQGPGKAELSRNAPVLATRLKLVVAGPRFAVLDASCRVHHGDDGEVGASHPKAVLSAQNSPVIRQERLIHDSKPLL